MTIDPWLLALALGSAFCYALGLVLAQFGFRSETPISGACISVPATMVFFVALSPWTIDLTQWNRPSAAVFAGVGLMFPALATFLTFTANRLIGPQITGTFSNVTPVFALAFGMALLGEVPTSMQMLGVLAVVAGAALVVLRRGAQVPVGLAWAMGLPLVVAVMRALAQAIVKIGLVQWPNAFAAVTIGYVMSALMVLSVGWARGELPAWGWRRERLWFVVVGVLNGVSVLLVYAALARGPITVVSALVACFPLFVVVLNRVLRGDKSLTLGVGLGVVLTVVGIVVLVRG
ncbi:MAG: DMT family transporter [Hyphomicrobiaceae bacterium]